MPIINIGQMENDIYLKTKERDDKMTFEEKRQEKINFTRQLRNIKLEKSDVYISQGDRYSQQQLDELNIYLKALRDMMQNEDWNDPQKTIEFPLEPDFILQKDLAALSFLQKL